MAVAFEVLSLRMTGLPPYYTKPLFSEAVWLHKLVLDLVLASTNFQTVDNSLPQKTLSFGSAQKSGNVTDD